MLPVRYDWIFWWHRVASAAAPRLSHAERLRPLTGVPVVVSVTLNFILTSSPALSFAFGDCGSALYSIAIPCSTTFCVGCCANAAATLMSRSVNIAIYRIISSSPGVRGCGRVQPVPQQAALVAVENQPRSGTLTVLPGRRPRYHRRTETTPVFDRGSRPPLFGRHQHRSLESLHSAMMVQCRTPHLCFPTAGCCQSILSCL